MKTTEMTVDFKSSVSKVFATVSNLADCSWRSDLLKIEKVTDSKFIEYDRKNRVTEILITDYYENIQFEYDVKNLNYSGHWSGQFVALKNGGCRLYLIFYFESHSIIGKFTRVDKFLTRYIEDLKKELGEN